MPIYAGSSIFPRQHYTEMTPNHTIIIAEAGVNHNGNEEMARRMIQVARDAGAGLCKIPDSRPRTGNICHSPKGRISRRNHGNRTKPTGHVQTYTFHCQHTADWPHYVTRKESNSWATPFDLVSIDCLATLGMDYWKIPSGEITNLPYLRKIAAKGGKIIMSTGMSTLQEVEDAVNILEAGGIIRKDIALLHCNTQYPTPMSDVNLRAMESLRKLRTGMVGYSDHTVGIEVPVAAVAMGAQIIEKHFTPRQVPTRTRPPRITRPGRTG